MKLPQFTVRDLLCSTALIAAGIGAPATALRLTSNQAQHDTLCTALLLASLVAAPILVGAGFILPFRKARFGTALAFLLILIVLFFVSLLPSVQ